MTNPTEAAMREEFEAAFGRIPAFMRNQMRIAFTRGWLTAQSHARAEAGAEYRNGFDDGLNSAAEYVERVYGSESVAYEIRGLQPPATLAEPQPTGAGE